MTREQQISKALQLLNPPPRERKRWRKRIDEGLLALFKLNEDDSFQGQKALTQYINALRKVLASYRALNPSMQRFFLLQTSDIESDLIKAETMQKHFSRRRPAKRPVNTKAKVAVQMAAFLLTERGCKLTTERSGQWHTLAQALADSSGDLRHHMTDWQNIKISGLNFDFDLRHHMTARAGGKV